VAVNGRETGIDAAIVNEKKTTVGLTIWREGEAISATTKTEGAISIAEGLVEATIWLFIEFIKSNYANETLIPS